MKKRVRIFVDGEVLVIKHFSGIGHYTADLLRVADKLLATDEYAHVQIELGVPYRLKHELVKYNFQNLSVKGMPFPIRVANGLKWRHRLPPIDLIHGKKVYVFPNYSSWPTLFSPSIPVVYDLSFVKHAQFVEPRNQAFLVDQVAAAVKRAAKVITISTNSRDEIVEHYGYPSDSIGLVYPAVDMHKYYRRSEIEIKTVKASYGIFGDYVLFVGNIEPRKNLISLLRAYRELPKQLQEKYSLLLIGAKGWLDNEIRDTIIQMRIEGLKIIQPTDYVIDADLPALYSGATVFAYVSRYEGFGIPPIEAMACGTPVISSNNSSLPEAVGSAAVQVGALDVPAITKALENTIQDKELRQKLVTAGYEQIKKFDWTESARTMIRLAEEASS